MKPVLIIIVVLGILMGVFFLLFVSVPHTDSYASFSDGSHVSIRGDKGTAHAWGVDFYVDGVKGTGTSAHSESRKEVESGQFAEIMTFNIGDIDIRMEKGPDSPISIWINGRLIGKHDVGARIEIDGQREVKVDGLSR